MSTPPKKKPRKKPALTVVPDDAIAAAAAEALAAASADEAVKSAFRDLLMDAATTARSVLLNGNPERQDRILAMFAAPAVRAALTPRGDDNTGSELDEFHRMRQDVFGSTSSSSESA